MGTIAPCTLLGGFSSSSVNAILPIIREDLQVTVAAVQWVSLGFMLVNSSLQLTYGRVGDLYGHKRLYLIGLAILSVGVLLASFTPTLGWLIGARVVQALGSAMFVAVTPVITTMAFPPEQRGRVLGIQSTTVYIGLAVGPTVGGFISDHLGWRSVFYGSLPLAALCALMALRYLPAHRAKAREGRFDPIGALLFTVGVTSFLFALSHVTEWGWLAPANLGLVALSVFALGAFVRWERRHISPMLDLTLFKIQLFRMSVISSILNFICFFGIIFMMPFYLIAARGWTAGQAGLVMVASPISMASVAIASGWASDRIGSRALASVGMLVLAAGLFA